MAGSPAREHVTWIVRVAKTDPSAEHAGISLFVVERGMEGFARGRKLDKIGLRAQDTAELIFEDVRVPAENRLGEVVDACVQLYGGYGFMRQYPIARAYCDARVARIYGGTNEIMKEIIGPVDGSLSPG